MLGASEGVASNRALQMGTRALIPSVPRAAWQVGEAGAEGWWAG